MTFNIPNGFSDDLHIWNYIPERALTASEVDFILKVGKEFASQWQVHGSPLKAEVIVQDKVLLSVIVDNDMATASGCSIDRSVAFVQQLEKELGVVFLNRMKLLYSSNEEIHIGDHRELENLPQNAVVFNHLSTDKASYIAEWLPAKSSWLAPQLG
tara:strand:- start:197808 stop:198275 length:468 start_codon:yes stop_codon:yes gene_type:complete